MGLSSVTLKLRRRTSLQTEDMSENGSLKVFTAISLTRSERKALWWVKLLLGKRESERRPDAVS